VGLGTQEKKQSNQLNLENIYAQLG
jgi:hypothetical protein